MWKSYDSVTCGDFQFVFKPSSDMPTIQKIFLRIYLPLAFLLLLPEMQDRVRPNLRGLIWSECEGYYIYLPGVFILKDVHKIQPGSMWPMKNDQGEMVLIYTCGVAIFEAPLFFVARAYAAINTWDADDYFREPYCWSVAYTGYIVCFLGLFFLRKALLRQHSEWTVFCTLAAVYAGTNLFHYGTKELGMSHVYSFFLFSFLVWHTPRFFEKPTWRNAALIGGTLGWMVLVRPTNAVGALFVLLYDVYTIAAFKARIQWLWSHWKQLSVAAATAFLFFIPQMMYWHEMTGHWAYYSCGEFSFKYWNKPKIAAVLFDSQNGLFLYSPMALVMVAGIFMGWRQKKHQALSIALIFASSTYLFASWWAWWFGGAFGHRSYVELYALLALPLAGVFDKILALRNKWLQSAILLVLAFLIFYSVRLSYLYHIIGQPWDGPEWRWSLTKMQWIWSHLF